MDKVMELSKVFSRYKIYPLDCYTGTSPLEAFRAYFLDNYYTKQITGFLSPHTYSPYRRGADLPWWGSEFFDSNGKLKTMLIAQDSLSKDAGSVVLYSFLYNLIEPNDEYSYHDYCSGLENEDLFKYHNWVRAYKQLLDWGINLNNAYITDASKVYKNNDRYKFDKDLSGQLLRQEIEVCKPDILILLGRPAAEIMNKTGLLDERIEFGVAVEEEKMINIGDIKCIVSPFITGTCQTGKNYKERIKIASRLIMEETHNT